jgi:L-alanine-DL-glutamate epimerase-like enolase superfamily enzyme
MTPGDTVMADAGGNWNLYDAIRVARAFDRPLPVTLIMEQPCATVEECAAFRQHCDLPIKLDELVDSPHAVLRAFREKAVEICNIQIARIGGLTKSRRLRDLCIDLGLRVVVQDRAGSDIVGAAVAHFAQSTAPSYLMDSFYFPSLVDVVTADGCPSPVDGHFTASSAPGLGISVHRDVLGNPLAVLGRPLSVS